MLAGYRVAEVRVAATVLKRRNGCEVALVYTVNGCRNREQLCTVYIFPKEGAPSAFSKEVAKAAARYHHVVQFFVKAGLQRTGRPHRLAPPRERRKGARGEGHCIGQRLRPGRERVSKQWVFASRVASRRRRREMRRAAHGVGGAL